MRDLMLPLSLTLLAGAIALHAVAPAQADPPEDVPQDDAETPPPAQAPPAWPYYGYPPPPGWPQAPQGQAPQGYPYPYPAPPQAAAAAPGPEAERPAPACEPIRLGTVKEVEGKLASLQARGMRDFGFPGQGMVCGW